MGSVDRSSSTGKKLQGTAENFKQLIFNVESQKGAAHQASEFMKTSEIAQDKAKGDCLNSKITEGQRNTQKTAVLCILDLHVSDSFCGWDPSPLC